MATANMTIVVDEAEIGTPLIERHIIVYAHEAEANPIPSSSIVPNGVRQGTQKFECQPVVGR
jgi:hypothetical protein